VHDCQVFAATEGSHIDGFPTVQFVSKSGTCALSNGQLGDCHDDKSEFLASQDRGEFVFITRDSKCLNENFQAVACNMSAKFDAEEM
jgi:hypothetical protein